MIPSEYGAYAAAEIARNSRREILFTRLYDNAPARHEAPAQRLGQLLVSLQGSIDAFAQALLGRTTARGIIQGEILSGRELAVIGTYDGSFGVQLATVAGVDMFGQSLVGDAIEELISLIDVGSDPEKLRVRLSSLRQRAASKYRALLTAIVTANTDVQVHWGSARGDRGRSAKLPIDIAREALTAIQSIETSLAETLQVECTLIGLNIRTKFYEIRTRTDRKKYSGEIADEAIADVQHAVINDLYAAMLRLRIEANPITGEERFRWELTALKRVRHSGHGLPPSGSLNRCIPNPRIGKFRISESRTCSRAGGEVFRTCADEGGAQPQVEGKQHPTMLRRPCRLSVLLTTMYCTSAYAHQGIQPFHPI